MKEFYCRYFSGLLAFYIVLRALSFFLKDNSATLEIIAALLIGTFIYSCIKDISLAWKLLVLELLLDGAGHFFELRSLLLRTWFLGIFACAWMIHKLKTRSKIIFPQKNISIALAIFGAFFFWAIINGLMHKNSVTFILQDAMLYLFATLLFPALEFEHNEQPINALATKIFIFGTTIFSVITFALYSSRLFFLTDPYYHWFRDIAAGKITDLGLNFFRIVLPEQILFVPIILVLLSGLIKKPTSKKIWSLLACSLIVVILNFTRIYFVALFVGSFFLLTRVNRKQWLRATTLTLAASAFIFVSFHFVASRGESIGLELLGVRASGISAPQSDVSGAIRLALLPDIIRHIKARPLLGSGLGTTITYLDPVTLTNQIRIQFDWGYLQMVTDLGILGTITYLAFLVIVMHQFSRVHRNSPFARGLIAGAIALFVINITTPALFQGFGVLYFAFLIVTTKLNSEIVD